MHTFDFLWQHLSHLARQQRAIPTFSGSSTYRLVVEADTLTLKSRDGRSDRPYSRKALRRLWGLRGTLGDPDGLRPKDLERRWRTDGHGRHGSYLWMIYREMRNWCAEPAPASDTFDHLPPDAARELRRDLKRALAGLDGGRGLSTVMHQIERIVKYVANDPGAMMAQSAERVARFVRVYAPWRLVDVGLPDVPFARLYRDVKDARNELAYTGTQAALAVSRTTALAVVMLEVLAAMVVRKQEGCLRVADVMVSNPTCAHKWQTLADVRRTMLVNDYSVLPVHDGAVGDGAWLCVGVERLANHLLDNAEGSNETLGRALSAGTAGLVYKARTVCGETPVRCLLGPSGQGLPVVVTTRGEGDHDAIQGIVTAFDLL